MSFTSLSLRVLNAYHPRLQTLCDYVVNLVNPETSVGVEQTRDILLKQEDSVSYHDFLTKTYVAVSPGSTFVLGELSPFQLTRPVLSMPDLIDRAQAKLFTSRKKGRPSNIITSGYRFGGYKSENGKGASGSRGGVTNFFVNTLITALQTADWTRLLSRTGDAVIFHLLSETSIYVPLPNDCFCQVTGPHLIYLPPPKSLPPAKEDDEKRTVAQDTPSSKARKRKRKVEETDISARPPKRLKIGPATIINRKKLASKKPACQPKTRSPADIPFARLAMFYSRPCRKSHNSTILLGLPSRHILNRMTTMQWRKEKKLLPDSDDDLKPGDRNWASEARHLSKYVFPLQYRLESVFTVPAEKLKDEQFERGYLADREAEINTRGSCKTPPRLKDVLALLGRLYHKHMKCGYKPILDKICPSKLTPSHKDASIDSSVVLDLIAEETTQELLRSQALEKSILGSMSDTTTTARRISLPKSQGKHKPKFAEFMCSHAQVFLYVRAVTKAVIPNGFWGCYRNRRTVLHYVKQFITGRRYEVMTLHSVMQGMSTSECDWLLPLRKPGQQYYHNSVESLKRRELLEEFIFWYFDQFVLPLLKTTFYITESSAFRNRVLYFRQDDWDILCRPLLDRLATTTFQRITQAEADELLKQRKLGYSFVRLLPKDSGVRPIVNLRRKAKKVSNTYEQNQSINQILSVAFSILTYEKESQADLLGASVFGPNEVYRKLKEFKGKMGGTKRKRPKFYFVKVDVQACFDTIEQNKLLGILKSIISEDAYLVQKYGQVIHSVGKIKRLFERKAMPEPDHPDFLTCATQLAALLHHTIFVDQVVYPIAYRDEIIELLEDHITSNIVKIGQDYYQQHIGIPQGSVLSSLLCSFFYGDLEQSVLQHLIEKENNVLLRLIDDYLFITTDESDAKNFLEVMKRGHPEYGCFISQEKTLINFGYGDANISELSVGGILHPEKKCFPWCGYLIDIEDLSVTADYSRFHDNYLIDSLTVERGRRPNSAFVQKTIQTAMAKSHPIYTDLVLNSPQTVYKNIHQAFMLAAMKMHAYIKATGKGGTSGLAFVLQEFHPSSSLEARKQGRCDDEVSSLRKQHLVRKGGDFVMNTIKQSIRYTYTSIKNKTSRHSTSISNRRDTGTIKKAIVEWLGVHAFYSILSLKRTAYSHAGILLALNQEVNHLRYRSIRRAMRRLTKESLKSMLKDVKF